MTRNRLLFLVDAVLLLVGLVGAYTGVALAFFIPRGRAGLLGTDFLPFLGTREEVRQVHTVANLALIGLVILHLTLHWSWIVRTARQMLRLPTKARAAGGSPASFRESPEDDASSP
jgi:thiosulfate reductase cytochrome b subunit